MLKRDELGAVDVKAYHNPDPYPERPKKPLSPLSGSPASTYRTYADDLEIYERDFEVWKGLTDAWQEKSKIYQARFKVDAMAEAGITSHPHADEIWFRAWSEGHSTGIQSVWEVLEDLCRFLEKIGALPPPKREVTRAS